MIPFSRALSFRFPLLTGADVRAAQQALRRAGATLAADGVFGPATAEAILAFQRAHGLRADGVIGPVTWARLNREAPAATTRPDWRAMLAPHLPRLTQPHSSGTRHWLLTAAGVAVDGTVRRAGTPTAARAWATHGAAMQRAAQAQGVPVELLLACACTESGGRADAVREEPGFLDDASTPHRVSPGLMQTLISTAREALADPHIDRARLLDPETSLAAGGAYIRRQALSGRAPTGFDPPLVAIAYNAGSLREVSPGRSAAAQNPWALVQTKRGDGWHADAFCGFFNDAFALFAAVPPDAATPSFFSILRGQ